MGEQQNTSKSFVEDCAEHMNAVVSNLIERPIPALVNQVDKIINFSELLQTVEVRPTDQIPEPPVCLSIHYNDQQSVVGTLGNFSLVIGKAKSRKTFAIGIALAAAIKRDIVLDRFVGSLPEDRPTVLYFDTEQGRFHVQRSVKRICDLSGLSEPSNLKAYTLRSMATKTRLEVIKWALYNTPGIGLVVIDGIRDLVFDINNPEEATSIATDLLKWTDDLQIHILTVLHQNKANLDARGHLGTELVNKAETVISISRDNENKAVSVVAPEYCRDKDFESFAFSIDEQGLPCMADELLTSKTDLLHNKRSSIDNLKPDQVETIIRRAFANETHFQYTKLQNSLIEAASFAGISLGKSKSEIFIRRITLEGLLIKSRLPKEKYDSYKINPEKLQGQLS